MRRYVALKSMHSKLSEVVLFLRSCHILYYCLLTVQMYYYCSLANGNVHTTHDYWYFTFHFVAVIWRTCLAEVSPASHYPPICCACSTSRPHFSFCFGDIVCFGQIDRGANQLEQCSCSEWDGWDSIHQLERCDCEWHSCIPWVCHSDGSEPAGSYGSLLEERPHLDLLPHCWLYLQRSLHGDLSILWTTPLCLII